MCHHYHIVSCNMKLNPLVFLYSVSGFVSNQLSLYYITLYILYLTKSGLVRSSKLFIIIIIVNNAI